MNQQQSNILLCKQLSCYSMARGIYNRPHTKYKLLPHYLSSNQLDTKSEQLSNKDKHNLLDIYIIIVLVQDIHTSLKYML